jgi:phage FluMu protein Com
MEEPIRTDKGQEKCKHCGKKLPVAVISATGTVILSMYCRHCGEMNLVMIKCEETK